MGGPAGGQVEFLVELGKALGVLSENGAVQSDWLQGPATHSKTLGPQRVAHLRNALGALFGEPEPPFASAPLELEAGTSVPTGKWYGFHPASPVRLVLGGEPDGPRLIGVGGRLSVPGLELLLQGWLAGITGPDFILPPTDPRIAPQILGRASLQVGAGPLGSIDLAAALSDNGLVAAGLSLTDSTGHISPAFDLTPTADTKTLLEAVRLALFCVRAVIRDQAQHGNPKAQLLVDHLLPLFGSTEDGPQPNPIPPFPTTLLLQGTAPLLDWLASLFPGPAAEGNPDHDPIAAILRHVSVLLGTSIPPQPEVDWVAWVDAPGAAGRVGLYADGEAALLILGLRGERSANVDGVRLTLEVRAPVAHASITEESIRASSGLEVKLSIGSPTPGALLVATDLGAALSAAELTGMGIDRAVITLRQHPARGMLADFSIEAALPDHTDGTVLGPSGLLLYPAGTILLAALPAGNPSVRTVVEDLFTALPLDMWLTEAGAQGSAKAIAAVRDLAARMLGVPPAPLLSIAFGTTLPASLELGIKAGIPGMWFVPGQTAGAAVRLEGAIVGAAAQDGAAGELTARLVSPLFDQFPVRPALELKLGVDSALELSVALVDGNGNASARWGLLPLSTPSLHDLLFSAIPLVLWTVSSAPELKVPLTGGGLCLGKLLELAGLGTWNGTTLTPSQPQALASLTPMKVLSQVIAGLIGQSLASWIATGPVEWKAYSQAGRLGVGLRPTGGAPLIDGDTFSLGYQGLDIDVLAQSPSGMSFSPTLHLKALAVTAHGSNGAPLLDVGPLSLGGAALSSGASAGIAGFALESVALTLKDLQLPFGGGGGMASQLLPAGEGPGFDITVGWTPAGLAVDISGKPSMWFDIDRQFGPLNVERVGVEWHGAKKEIAVVLDGNFSLAGIRVQPDGLGIVLPLNSLTDPGGWAFSLRGLGLSYNQGGISISGLFRNKNGDFQGAALVKAYSYQLGAIGAYKALPDGPSLFIFAALAAPLGGPPWFFITGVAGGFGYNRALTVPDNVDGIAKLPFFGLMKGDLDLSQIQSIGDVLDTYLMPQRNTLWLAGGLTFTSFALIKGQALLYVVIGPHFELGVMALCGFQVPKIVNVELALKARFTTAGNDPNLLIMGGLTDKSWLLGGACKLHGGFAMQIWFNTGDCVLSLGGYSPEFHKPARYPIVDRLGFKWSLSDAIVLKGDCYFALTPREAMGGSHFDVTGHWGPLSAGFYCWFDVLVGWDPFYFSASLDIGVWGRVSTALGDIGFELGVHIKLHGPPIGGNACIDLAIISIDIPFGTQSLPNSNTVPIGTFASRFLEMRLPKAMEDDEHLQVPARAKLDPQGEVLEHGLLLVEVRRGLISEDGTAADGSQAKPYRLVPEFELVIRTRVPLASSSAIFSTYQDVFDPVATPKQEPLNFYPSKRGGLTSTLYAVYGGNLGAKPVASPWIDMLPEALFGDAPGGDDEEMTVARVAGIRIDGTAQPVVALAGDHSLGQRISQGADILPLPLGSRSRPLATLSTQLGTPQRLTVANLKQLSGGMAIWARQTQAPLVIARLARMIEPGDLPAAVPGQPIPPLAGGGKPVRATVKAFIPLKSWALPMTGRTTVTALDGVPRVAVPRAVLRPPALAGVTLQISSTSRSRPGTARAVRTGLNAASLETLARMSSELLKQGTTLPAGCAIVGGLEGSRRGPARLSLTGDQPVRVVALGAFGALIWDRRVGAGTISIDVPSEVRQLVLFGLGIPAATRKGGEPSPTGEEGGGTTAPSREGLSASEDAMTTREAVLAGDAELIVLKETPATLSRLTLRAPNAEELLAKGVKSTATVSREAGTTAPGEDVPSVAGFDSNTLLISTGDRSAVGPGCVAIVRKGRPLDARPDRITGAQLLAQTDQLEVTFSVPTTSSTLLVDIEVPPLDGSIARLSSSVSWRSTLPLPTPQAVVGTDRVLLLFNLLTSRQAAVATFRVTIDLSGGYRVRAIAVRTGAAESIRETLAASTRWFTVPQLRFLPVGATLVQLALNSGAPISEPLPEGGITVVTKKRGVQ